MKKSVSLILCICLVLGASAPAFALPISTNVLLDNSKYENYLAGANGTWNYSESINQNVNYPEAGTWATAMLRQLYSVFKYTYYINNSLESNSSYQTSNFGKAMYYFSTASFQNKFNSLDSYLDLISTRVNLVNTYLTTYLPDIESGILSVATHAGNISSMLGFTTSNTLKSNIDSIISGITSSNTNTSNIKSVLDNLYGALGYNSAGTLKTAINSIISNTSDISGIKSGTDYLDDIAADTSSLPTIENNTSAIKINSDYLPGISTYASNLPGIKSDTAYLDDIYNALSSISIPTYDLDNVDWSVAGSVTGVFDGNGNSLVSNAVQSVSTTFQINSALGNIFYFSAPFSNDVFVNTNPVFEIGLIRNGVYQPINDAFVISSVYNVSSTNILFYMPNNYPVGTYNYYLKATTDQRFWVTPGSINNYPYVYGISLTKKDFYDVASWVNLDNIRGSLDKLNSYFIDPVSEAAKDSNVNNQTTVLNNFTGSGAASATPTDFSDLSSGVSSVKNGLNTGVSLSNLFGIFNNSDGYSWFSSQVLNEINTVQSSTRTRGSSTQLYDQKINEILSYMGVE